MFREILFPVCISYDAVGGPYWPTDVVRLKSGVEHRNQPWSHPIRKYSVDLSDHNRRDILEFIDFWENQQGTEFGFRWKDWIDFTSGIAYDNITGADEQLADGDGSSTTFQLIKTYPGGSVRKILKPVKDTIIVTVNGGAPSGDVVCDTTNGIVFFENAPANGATVRAGFEYDVPVRFSESSVGFNLEDFQQGNVSNLDIEEMRIDPDFTSPATQGLIADYFSGSIPATSLPSTISVV